MMFVELCLHVRDLYREECYRPDRPDGKEFLCEYFRESDVKRVNNNFIVTNIDGTLFSHFQLRGTSCLLIVGRVDTFLLVMFPEHGNSALHFQIDHSRSWKWTISDSLEHAERFIIDIMNTLQKKYSYLPLQLSLDGKERYGTNRIHAYLMNGRLRMMMPDIVKVLFPDTLFTIRSLGRDDGLSEAYVTSQILNEINALPNCQQQQESSDDNRRCEDDSGDENVDENSELACPVCYLHKKKVSLSCGHVYCHSCVKSVHRECHVCRKTVSIAKRQRVYL